MRKKEDSSHLFSPKSAHLLRQFDRFDSVEAFLAAHPEYTEADVDRAAAEVQRIFMGLAAGGTAGTVKGAGAGKTPHEPGKAGKTGKAAGTDRGADNGGYAYQLKITLRRSKPPIWRHVVVPVDLPLAALHDVIQIAMGWEDCHLHHFIIDGERFIEASASGNPLGDDDDDLDEAEFALYDVISGPKARFRYEYDFGDSWEHEILVEKILSPIEQPEGIVCLAGKNRCPLEDSGGLWGYYEKLRAVSDPNHPEHGRMKEWMGEIDPREFDRDDVNARLRILKR